MMLVILISDSDVNQPRTAMKNSSAPPPPSSQLTPSTMPMMKPPMPSPKKCSQSPPASPKRLVTKWPVRNKRTPIHRCH